MRLRSGVSMAGGIGLLGLSGFAFLAVAGHGRFSPVDTAALSVTYLCTNVLGPGIFVAIEQETNRRLARSLASDGAQPAQLPRLALVAAGLAALTCLALLIAAPWLLPRLLGGHLGLLLALMAGAIGSAAVYYVRGVCAGSGQLGRYGATLITDGALRIAGTALVLITDSVSGLGLALGLAPGLAALICSPGLRRRVGRAPAHESTAPPPGELVGTVAVLVASWLLMLGMANLGGVVARALSPDVAMVAVFTAAVALTRVPVMLFGPFQAVVLPQFTAAATIGDRAGFRRQVLRAGGWVAAIGALTVLGLAVLGPWALRLLFGVDSPGTPLLIGLGLGAAVLLALQILQPAVLALGRHRAVLVACGLGLIVFVGCFLLPIDPFDRATLAQLAGPAVTVAAFVATMIGHSAVGSTSR